VGTASPTPTRAASSSASGVRNGSRSAARTVSPLPRWSAAPSAVGRGTVAPPPRPDYSRDVGAARPGERRLGEHRLSKWTREDCVASVARYLEQAAGSRSTQRGYSSWAATQESAPVLATLELHGGWETMRKLAQEELRRRHRRRPQPQSN
jgi:hypothetical protein